MTLHVPDRTPKTQWRMFWCGQWRPVLNMYDAANQPTTLTIRTVKVVLYAELRGKPSMVVTGCTPADILMNPDHVTQTWDAV